jgi:hypothetical protein
MKSTPNLHKNTTPESWDNNIHQVFLKGNIHNAIENTVGSLNAMTDKKT